MRNRLLTFRIPSHIFPFYLCRDQPFIHTSSKQLSLSFKMCVMKNERYETMLTLLQSQLEEEKQAYRSGLIDNKEFWMLKLIKERIKSIESEITSLKQKVIPFNPIP